MHGIVDALDVALREIVEAAKAAGGKRFGHLRTRVAAGRPAVHPAVAAANPVVEAGNPAAEPAWFRAAADGRRCPEDWACPATGDPRAAWAVAAAGWAAAAAAARRV